MYSELIHSPNEPALFDAAHESLARTYIITLLLFLMVVPETVSHNETFLARLDRSCFLVNGRVGVE